MLITYRSLPHTQEGIWTPHFSGMDVTSSNQAIIHLVPLSSLLPHKNSSDFKSPFSAGQKPLNSFAISTNTRPASSSPSHCASPTRLSIPRPSCSLGILVGASSLVGDHPLSGDPSRRGPCTFVPLPPPLFAARLSMN